MSRPVPSAWNGHFLNEAFRFGYFRNIKQQFPHRPELGYCLGIFGKMLVKNGTLVIACNSF